MNIEGEGGESDGLDVMALLDQGAKEATSSVSPGPAWEATATPVGQATNAGPSGPVRTEEPSVELDGRRKKADGAAVLRDMMSEKNLAKSAVAGYNALLRLCASKELDDDEAKAVGEGVAFYIRSRMGKGGKRVPPEVVLMAALAMPVISRPEVVNVAVEKSAPLVVRAGKALWSVIAWPFRGKKKEVA